MSDQALRKLIIQKQAQHIQQQNRLIDAQAAMIEMQSTQMTELSDRVCLLQADLDVEKAKNIHQDLIDEDWIDNYLFRHPVEEIITPARQTVGQYEEETE